MMKPFKKQHNSLKGITLLTCLICFFLISCSENKSINSVDTESNGIKASTNSLTVSPLINKSSLQPGCSAANAWVKAHANNLPTKFEAISKYPLGYQKAIFSRLSARQKANVWTDRLLKILNDIALTEKQQALLNDIINDISPTFYSKKLEKKSIIDEKTLKSVFGEKLAKNIFASLSSVQEVKKTKTTSIVYEMMNQAMIIAPPGDVVCDCSAISDYCTLGSDESSCVEWSHDCNFEDNSCGTLWGYACIGLCETN